MLMSQEISSKQRTRNLYNHLKSENYTLKCFTKVHKWSNHIDCMKGPNEQQNTALLPHRFSLGLIWYLG